MQNYEKKYLKYKTKYLNSKQMTGGNPGSETPDLTLLAKKIEEFKAGDRIKQGLYTLLYEYSIRNEENKIAVIELLDIHDIKSSDGSVNIDKVEQLVRNFLYIVDTCKYHSNDAVILAINNIDDDMRSLLLKKIPRFFIMKYLKLDESNKKKFISDINKGVPPLFAGHALHLLGDLKDEEEDKLIDFIKNKKSNGTLMEIIEELNLIRKCASRV